MRTQSTRRPQGGSNRRYQIEALESREVMAANFAAGVLTLTGTTSSDSIEVFGRGAGIVEVVGGCRCRQRHDLLGRHSAQHRRFDRR